MTLVIGLPRFSYIGLSLFYQVEILIRQLQEDRARVEAFVESLDSLMLARDVTDRTVEQADDGSAPTSLFYGKANRWAVIIFCSMISIVLVLLTPLVFGSDFLFRVT